jgi:hypothetical protein
MMSYNFLDPCFRRDGVWILAGVYPVLDSGFRQNDRCGTRMTEWEDKN